MSAAVSSPPPASSSAATGGSSSATSAGVSNDPLIYLFPLINRLFERGAPLPFLFPETVVYEHHFPRGWFSIEKEAASVAAMRNTSTNNGVTGGTGATMNIGEGATGSSHNATSSTSEGLANALERLREASPFLKATTRYQPQSSRSGLDTSTSTPDSSSSHQRFVLIRKNAKECDSGVIRKAFSSGASENGGDDQPSKKDKKSGSSSSSPRPRKRITSCLSAICVSRNPNTSELVVRYLDDPGLKETLMNTPETCILSKAVVSERVKYDVIIATWTPSVFTIEHRQNHNLLSDTSIPIRDRGDTTNPSKYEALQCSPLTARRIREQLQMFIGLVATYERKRICEIRAYFRPDAKERLWLLWVDECRFATPKPQVSLLRTIGSAQETYEVFWNRVTNELQLQQDSVMRRSQRAKIWGTGPAQDRDGESDDGKMSRLEKTHYGRHPSFTRPSATADPDTLDKVETQLNELLAKAGNKQALKKKNGGGGGGGGSDRSPTSRNRTSSNKSSVGSESLSWSPQRQSLATNSSQDSSSLRAKIFAGTSYERRSSCGLEPMIPLSLQPPASEQCRMFHPSVLGDSLKLDESGRDHSNEDVDDNENVVRRGTTTTTPPHRQQKADVSLLSPSSIAAARSPSGGGEGKELNRRGSVRFLSHHDDTTTPDDPFGHFVPLSNANANSLFSSSPQRQATSPSSDLGERRRSFTKIAERPVDARGTPSKWMRTVRDLSSNTMTVMETPRGGDDHHHHPSGHHGSGRRGDRSGSITSVETAAQQQKRKVVQQILRGPAVRPFVPSEKRQQRARASVLLSERAELLDIGPRLQYNELKRQHVSAVEDISDLEYYCISQEMKSREPCPILFDMPPTCPEVPDAVMKNCGFCLTKDNEELDKMYMERFYFVAHTINVPWAFEHLKAAVEDLCYVIQIKFWGRLEGGESHHTSHTESEMDSGLTIGVDDATNHRSDEERNDDDGSVDDKEDHHAQEYRTEREDQERGGGGGGAANRGEDNSYVSSSTAMDDDVEEERHDDDGDDREDDSGAS